MPRSGFHTGLDEVVETLRMIEIEHLDIRTVTLGLNLLDLAGSDARLPDRIYQRITEIGGPLVRLAQEVEDDLGVPIVNKRVSVTPIAMVCAGGDRELVLDVARALDRAAEEIGVDYIAGFSALVHKGITNGDATLIECLPQGLAATQRLCGSVNVASTRSGINMDAVGAMGHAVLGIAEATRDRDAIGCARFVCFANAVEDNPFVAGAFHGVGEHQAVLNVGISGPGVVNHAVRRLMQNPPPSGIDLGNVADVIKRMAFKVTRAGELVGRVVASRLGPPVRFGVIDLSLAPTPAEGDSVADILEAMGLQRVGAPGTLAALFLLTDAVKKGGAMGQLLRRGPVRRVHPRVRRPRHGGGGQGRRPVAREARGHDQHLLGGARHGGHPRRHSARDHLGADRRPNGHRGDQQQNHRGAPAAAARQTARRRGHVWRSARRRHRNGRQPLLAPSLHRSRGPHSGSHSESAQLMHESWITDCRERTLALVSDLDDAQLIGPRLAIVNPMLWEIGHVAWFWERWVLRHCGGRGRPCAPTVTRCGTRARYPTTPDGTCRCPTEPAPSTTCNAYTRRCATLRRALPAS